MKTLIFIISFLFIGSAWSAEEEVLTAYEEIMEKQPDIDRPHVRVWTIKQTNRWLI